MPYTETETMDPAARAERKDERLRETVRRAYENVDYYRAAFDDAGVAPADVDGVGGLHELPLMTKEDFRDNYPDDLFAVPRAAVACIHASSGTTGKPKIVGYTETDVDVWREVMARSLYAAGVRPEHTVQNAYGYGLFTGGLGVHHGCDELGAAVVPVGGGQTQRQIELLTDLGSEVFTCTPSYALYLAEEAEAMGVDVRDLPLSTVVFGAEPATEPMREAIEDRLGVTAVDLYGLSEIIGPGVSIECAEAQDGLHVWEDHFHPEVIDPRTGEPLPEGEEGELVLTTLTKTGVPAIRYRTGDLTTLRSGECACGRTTVRMDNVTGRADDLLVVRGVNLYPSEIESVVLEFDEVAPHYRIDLYREGHLDEVEIAVELAEGFDGRVGDLRERIERRLENVLSFSPDALDLVEPGAIERTEVGKVQRVYDHR